jgi:endoglucanase
VTPSARGARRRAIAVLVAVLGAAVALAAAAIAHAPARAAEGAPVAAQAADVIRLNQVAFYPDGPKVAVVVDAAPATFAVLTADRGDTVLTGPLSPARRWAPSDEPARTADFGRLARPGRYVLAVPGSGVGAVRRRRTRRTARSRARRSRRSTSSACPRRSRPSTRGVGRAPPATPTTRSSCTRRPRRPRRPAGRRAARRRAAGTTPATTTSTSSTPRSARTRCSCWPSSTPRPTPCGAPRIPESGNALPDALDEALWNLRWMRRMQDPADGGVYTS